jgi:hypothetical protein
MYEKSREDRTLRKPLGRAGGDAELAVERRRPGEHRAAPGPVDVAAGDVRVWATDAKSPSRVIPRERGALGRSPVRVAAFMDADKTRAWISAERFAPFLEQAEGDQALAFDLYLWHARISGASLTTLHHFEVALRNAIDRQLGTGKGPPGRRLRRLPQRSAVAQRSASHGRTRTRPPAARASRTPARAPSGV